MEESVTMATMTTFVFVQLATTDPTVNIRAKAAIVSPVNMAELASMELPATLVFALPEQLEINVNKTQETNAPTTRAKTASASIRSATMLALAPEVGEARTVTSVTRNLKAEWI